MTHLDAVVHHHVPVLTSQDLQRCSFTNTSIIVNYKRGISYIGISETWKTVKQAWKKSSKVAREASGPNLPPKSWKKDSQEWKEEKMAPACRGGRRWRWRERGGRAGRRWRRWSPRGTWPSRPWLSSTCERTTDVVEDQLWVVFTYFVTLKALKRRMHLITERPTGGTTWQNSLKGGKQKMWKQTKTVLTPTSNLTSVYSKMELQTTKKSNLLKSETM